MLAFAALFVVGGWVSIGTPPKPFAPAEGLFVSGAWLQAVIMAPVLLGLSRPGAAPVAVIVDRALGLFWRLSGLCLILVAALVFIWASGRALFDLGALPPSSGWSVLPAGLSRSEAWWLETTMALFGLALCLSISTLLRADGHVRVRVSNLVPLVEHGVAPSHREKLVPHLSQVLVRRQYDVRVDERLE